LDVIKTADYIIDLGPEGGDEGGNIVAFGTIDKIIKNKKSHTGKYLEKIIKNDKKR
jgi:excinuclease ABC subunit A